MTGSANCSVSISGTAAFAKIIACESPHNGREIALRESVELPNAIRISESATPGSLNAAIVSFNLSVTHAGDLQRMSAGTGVTHSEFNNSESEPVRFLQIWFLPDHAGHKPGYEQKFFSPADKRGRFKLVASANGDKDSVSLNQDVNFFAGLIDQDEQAFFEINENRDVWVQIASGSIKVNGEDLRQGDSIAITQTGKLNFTNGNNAEVVIFDMTRKI